MSEEKDSVSEQLGRTLTQEPPEIPSVCGSQSLAGAGTPAPWMPLRLTGLGSRGLQPVSFLRLPTVCWSSATTEQCGHRNWTEGPRGKSRFILELSWPSQGPMPSRQRYKIRSQVITVLCRRTSTRPKKNLQHTKQGRDQGPKCIFLNCCKSMRKTNQQRILNLCIAN